MKKISIGTKIVGGILGLLGLITLNSALYTLDQTQQAVITQFGRPVKVIVNPVKSDEELLKKLKEGYKEKNISFGIGAGLKVKMPFIQSVNYLDRRLLEWDGSPEEIPTKDKRYIFVDTTARWYINDPLLFLQTVRTETTALARLDDVIDSVVRGAVTDRNLIEAVRNSNRKMEVVEEELREAVEVEEIKEGREKIMREATSKSRETSQKYGMEIVDTRITGINYVESVKGKIEDRMIAERRRVAEGYRSEGQGEYQKIMGKKELELKTIMSEAYKKAQEIKGKADAEATEIYAGAYSKDPEFYQFLNTLETCKEILPGTNLVTGTDTELLKYLKGFEEKK